jgi:ABC-2 type transport system permease protein
MTTQTFQPTFMQKLLGRNYKWWYVVLYDILASTNYRLSTFFVVIRDLIPVFISLTIYGSFLDSREFIEYFLLGNLFFKIVLLFADINWEIRHAIAYGTISKYLIRPTNWLKYEFFSCIGGNLFSVTINVLIFVFLIMVNSVHINFSLINILQLLLSLIIAIVIYFCIDVTVGAVTFWTPETNVLIDTKLILTPFLAGSLVFLSTNSITKSFVYLPWSFLVHHPMQIYLGKYDINQTILVFLGGIFWCVILYFLANFVFKMGLKRNESVWL